MKLTEGQLVAGIYQQLQNSDSWQSGELAENRRKALNYYFGEPRGDEAAGCSAVISTDVADMIEAVIAGMMPALETDQIIEFESMGQEDDDAARRESEAVNWVVMNQNHGYIMLQQAIRDALLLRNGFTKCYVHTKTESNKNTFTIDPALLPFFVQSPPPGFQREIISYDDADDGQIKVRAVDTRTERLLKVCSVDPCNVFYTAGWDSYDLQDIPFFCERHLYTRSQLIEMGYSKAKVDALPRITVDTSEDAQARNNTTTTPNLVGITQSQDVIECFEAYWHIDADGDGLNELRRIFVAGRTILSNEEYEFIPYATGTPFIQPHRLTGMSLFDKLRMVQDVKTAALRQYLDCFQNGNLGRVGYVKGMVNTNHLLNPRPSGAVEVDDPNAIFPLPSIDIGPSAQALLDYMDKVRSSRGGASLDLQSAEAQIMGETAQGVERQYSVREMLAAMMAKTIAETLVAGTYRNVHKALRLFVTGEMTYRNRQGAEKTDPAQWPERTRIVVRGGLSMGEQRKKVQALSGVIQQQQMLLGAGMNGILIDLTRFYQASIDWARASGIDNAEAYFINPASPESQQAQQSQAQQAQQQQQMAQALQQLQIQMAQQAQAFEKYKVDEELRFKYYDSNLDAEVQEAKITGDNVTKITVEQLRKELGNDEYRQGRGGDDGQ